MICRAAGVLLHPTSLPDGPGGRIGSAKRFLGWASDAGFSVWQVLPLGPAGPGRSPYASPSAFAGDPTWFAAEPSAHAGEGRLYDEFVERNQSWIEDWCLYAALKDRLCGQAWTAWDPAFRNRDRTALARAASELSEHVARHRRDQYRFHVAWSAIHAEAKRVGIRILGDVPIYPALDSADVWAHPELFLLDEEGNPTKVAGVPPDYFSDTGQLWGNPLYRWEAHAATGFGWWIARLTHQMRHHDELRLDHFRGFAGSWAIPAIAETAAEGAWEPGPGRALFDAVRAALGSMPFIAEDLGFITGEVIALREALGLPGMRVLQFGFDDPASDHAPHALSRDVVVYTGTHDNDTARGWFASLDTEAKARVIDYVGGDGAGIAWSLIRTAFTSVADLAIVPMQDLLDFGSEARMNVPGVANGNWGWKLGGDALEGELQGRIGRLIRIAGR